MLTDLVYILLLPIVCLIINQFIADDKKRNTAALITSIISFLFALHTIFEVNYDEKAHYVFDHEWISSLGIHFKIGMDGISFLLVLLTNILIPLIILSSFNREIKNRKAFFSLIFFMQFALIGVFTALDGFLFYVFWELALIPIYFICLLWGGKDRIRITLKFFIYTLAGSLFMLIGLIYLYLQTPGSHSFDIEALYNLTLTAHQQTFIFWCMFVAFAIKMPIFPLHTWQPDTYTDAPTQGTMLLSGIMLKMGIYGVIRWLLPIVPQGSHEWASTAMILSVIGIVYASCLAIVQLDYKRLIAYSSIAHVGLISAGVFSFNMQGFQGAMVQMFSHGINVVGLFLVADILMDRFKTREIDQLGGIANSQSKFAMLFMIVMLGSVALPLTNGFVGEFLLLAGIFQFNTVLTIFAGLTVILGAVYMLRSYQKIIYGEANSLTKSFGGLYTSESAVLIVVSIVIIVTGIYPKPLLNLAEPSLKNILDHINSVQ